MTSTPAVLTFSMVERTWLKVSPQPSIIEVLVNVPGGAKLLASLRTLIDWSKLARWSRTWGWSSSTVSMLWAKTSSPDVATLSTHSGSPWKSGTERRGKRTWFQFFVNLREINDMKHKSWREEKRTREREREYIHKVREGGEREVETEMCA